MKRDEIKIRKSWGDVKPYQQPHSTKKGKKGYSRKEKHKKALW